ncbi:MAG: Trk system potassium transporter TrkA [Eubacterium sp.]|nr:Trk system potassium transporter TrkA [Eubacterium sp.]
MKSLRDFVFNRGINTPVKKGLKIIIVGCGKVGVALVEQLSQEGHDITIIDTDADTVQEVANLYDVMGMAGNGASYQVQMEAGIDKTDLIIAVTESDELNLLCCTVAKQVGDCAAIARVRTPDYSQEVEYLREKLGLAMIINPELEAAREAARILYLPTALEARSFARGKAELIKFVIPEDNHLHGMTIAQIGKNFRDVLVCAVERNKELFIPGGDFRMKEGDIVSFVAPRVAAKAFLQGVGFETHQVKNTLILGGGKCGYYLAQRLLQMGIEVKIIEQNKKRCEELSILLPKAVIINGDVTDQQLLEEEGIEYAESVVPLTGLDEENILLTLYTKSVSGAKVITKINRITFMNTINSLNLGSVIYPRYITSEAILKYVRAKKETMDSSNIETLYHMFDSRVEAIEFNVTEESGVTDIPLMDLQFKNNLLICMIYRDGDVIIPGGQDCIRPGDSVMIVTAHKGLVDIEDILL